MLNPPELNTRELNGKPCKVYDVREVFTQNFNRFLRQLHCSKSFRKLLENFEMLNKYACAHQHILIIYLPITYIHDKLYSM